MSQAIDYKSVFFLILEVFGPRMLKKFLKVTWIMSLMNCHFRFSIFVLKTVKLRSHWQCSQYLKLNHTCVLNNTRPWSLFKFSRHFQAANPYLWWCCISLDHRLGIRYRNSNGLQTLNSKPCNNPETCKEHQVIQTQTYSEKGRWGFLDKMFEILDGKHNTKWLLLQEESTFSLECLKGELRDKPPRYGPNSLCTRTFLEKTAK